MGRRDLANGVRGQGRGGASRPGSPLQGVRAGNGDTARSCGTRGGRAHPYGRGWGRGGDYKMRGGARAAAERAKLWPGADYAHYGDAGPGTGLCGEVSALA